VFLVPADDLLDALRRAFLDARRVTRTRRANRTKPSIASSMVTRPTFERSMMAMSFLMFGVFVIRVVQVQKQRASRAGQKTPAPGFGRARAILFIFLSFFYSRKRHEDRY